MARRLFRLFLALSTIGILSPTYSAPNSRVHALCKDTKDYQGCAKSHSEGPTLDSKVDDKPNSKEFIDCMHEIAKSVISQPFWMKYSDKQNEFKLACSTSAEVFNTVMKESQGNSRDVESIRLRAIEAAGCSVVGVFEGKSPDISSKSCLCAVGLQNKNPSYSLSSTLRYCMSQFNTNEIAGFRLLFKQGRITFCL
jgi:hypothetical protein